MTKIADSVEMGAVGKERHQADFQPRSSGVHEGTRGVKHVEETEGNAESFSYKKPKLYRMSKTIVRLKQHLRAEATQRGIFVERRISFIARLNRRI